MPRPAVRWLPSTSPTRGRSLTRMASPDMKPSVPRMSATPTCAGATRRPRADSSLICEVPPILPGVMTAIHDDASSQPRTHALLIGVGHYPYLPGGGATTTATTLGLGQLASPPISAVRLAHWLINEFNNAQAPLGSVELLVSPAPGGALPPWPAEGATLANVRAAYKRWLARCDLNPGNLALFYYCGHGV